MDVMWRLIVGMGVASVACSDRGAAPQPRVEPRDAPAQPQDAPRAEPIDAPAPQQTAVAPPKDPCGKTNNPCPLPPGLEHPNGTRECNLECGDEAAARSAAYSSGGYSPPSGKDERAASQCLEQCIKIRAGCAQSLNRGDDVLAECVTKLATKNKGRDGALCVALRSPTLVDSCRAAVYAAYKK